MPNYCDCELDVEGDRNELERLVKMAASPEKGVKVVKYESVEDMLNDTHVDATALDFNNFVPIPDFDMHETGTHPRWYSWSVEHWGTKWNASESKVIVRKTVPRVRFNFMTAWSPPLPVVLAMSKQFPTLRFELRFYEQGMAFQGRYVARNGKWVEQWEAEYHGHRGG